jgi:hypothetical protein
MRSVIFCAVMCVTFTGCSTAPVSEKTGKPIPADRVFTAPTNEAASALFTRDGGFLGSACPHDIFVNDVKAFTINQGEFIELGLKPGPYIFRFESHVGLCPDITMTQVAELKDGDRQEYRILIPSDWGVRFIRTK